MKKKVLSMLLCLCMVLMFFPATAFAAESSGSCSKSEADNVNWSFDSTTGTLTISGTGEMADYSASADGGIVTSDNRPWKNFLNNIQSVVIENGVTTIGNMAFFYCTNLKSANIPASVTKINYSAYTRSGIESVTIAGDVDIDQMAFDYCNSLKSITINGNANISRRAFDACIALKDVTIGGEAKIGYNAFGYCPNLTNIYLFDNITPLSENIFSDRYPPTFYGYTGKNVATSAESLGCSFASLDGDCSAAQDNSVKWKLSFDGTLTISGAGETADYSTADEPWKILAENGMIKKVVIEENSTVTSGTFDAEVINKGTISGGIFNNTVTNSGTITGGLFKTAPNGFETWDVTFKPENGNADITYKAVKDTTITPIEAPTRDDYAFSGWYEKDDDKFKADAFDFANTKVTGDITLYASWTHVAHTGGTADCTHKAVCTVCGEEYGTVDAKTHTTLRHVDAKAATTESDGNIEYWHCEDCDKYFSDKNCKNEITLANTVIAKLSKTDSDKESPQTGDNSYMALGALLVVIGVSAGTAVYGKKKKYSVK